MLLCLALLACLNAADGAPAASPPPPAMSPPPAEPPAPAWPQPGAPLRAPEAPPWPGPPLTLMIDAGHGAPGNLGNTGARCQQEADFTRATQDAVLARLAGDPALQLSSGRPTAELRSYDALIADIKARRPDAVISLHSDTRAGDGWTVGPSGCYEGRGAVGFSVLYSDEGPEAVVEGRLRLARAVARRMSEAGFPAYGGEDYVGLYAPSGDTPGVFVDRHAPRQRIRMLRAVSPPLVIVETHQAVDPEESARWDEPATLDAFAAALRAAVIDAAMIDAAAP